MEASAEKKKELVLFEGSLKDYAEMLLKDKRGDGSVINLGKIHEAIIKELSKRDIQLVDTPFLRICNHERSKDETCQVLMWWREVKDATSPPLKKTAKVVTQSFISVRKQNLAMS